MNDTSRHDALSKLKQEDLPMTVKDVSAVDQMESQRMLGGLMIAIGLIPLLYGAYLMFFGPDHIMVDRFAGPTFWETIRLNPGAIASLRFVIVALGRLVRQSSVKKVTRYMDDHFMLVNRFGKKAEDARFFGQPTKEGHLVLHYQQIELSDNTEEKV